MAWLSYWAARYLKFWSSQKRTVLPYSSSMASFTLGDMSLRSSKMTVTRLFTFSNAVFWNKVMITTKR